MVPNAYAPSQQFQAQAQVGHSRRGLEPPPLPSRPTPPVQPTVQPGFPRDYANVPRVPYQQGTGYVISQVNHSGPSFPEAHIHRAPDQTPLYGRNGPPGRPEPPPYLPTPPPVPNQSESLITRGLPSYGRSSSRESYSVQSHRSPPPQMYVSQAA